MRRTTSCTRRSIRERKQLSTTETITYTNNSPDVLPSLWVQLEQNIYRKDSRAQIASGGWRRDGGEQLRIRRRRLRRAPRPMDLSSTRWRLSSGKQTAKADYLVSDTRMQIRLAAAAGGDTAAS